MEPLNQWPNELIPSMAGSNLAYLKVYLDHKNRRHWRGGRFFALNAKANCPEGKVPALLLTNRRESEIAQFTLETEDEQITVVCVDVVTRTGDTHSSYLASVTGTGAKDYDNLKLNRQINSDDIRAWISEHPGQIKELAKILVETEPADDSSDAFDDETYEAFRKIVSASPNVIRNLGEAASESLNLRIEKVKQEADEFSLLLCDDKSNETTCQTWLEEHPWVFGLEYVKVRKGQQTSRGYVDFLLERYDGFHDLLELKSPQDDIIVAKEGKDTDTIPSPTNYKLSDSLSNAIAQAHSYKVRLSRDEKHMEEEHGVKNSGSPRLIVVVGLKEKMPQHSALILDELNRSLHGVEIVPYDLIAKRARMLVANAEKFLIGIPTDSESNEQ